MKAWAPILAVLLGCGDDTVLGDTAPAADLCEDAPVVTWSNFGQGFTIEHCQACHASSVVRDGTEAYPAEDAYFDTHDDVLRQADTILWYTTGLAPAMPPAGGPTEEDRYKLEVWLSCYPEL